MTEFIELFVDNGDKQELTVGLNELRLILVLMTLFKILLIKKTCLLS